MSRIEQHREWNDPVSIFRLHEKHNRADAGPYDRCCLMKTLSIRVPLLSNWIPRTKSVEPHIKGTSALIFLLQSISRRHSSYAVIAREQSSAVATNCRNGMVRFLQWPEDIYRLKKHQTRAQKLNGSQYSLVELEEYTETWTVGIGAGKYHGHPLALEGKIAVSRTSDYRRWIRRKEWRPGCNLSQSHNHNTCCPTSVLLIVHSVAFKILRSSSIRNTSITTAPTNSNRGIVWRRSAEGFCCCLPFGIPSTDTETTNASSGTFTSWFDFGPDPRGPRKIDGYRSKESL